MPPKSVTNAELGERVARIEERVENLREDFAEGRREQKEAHADAKRERETLKEALREMREEFADLKSQARGGWKVIAGLVAVASALGALAHYTLAALKFLPLPK